MHTGNIENVEKVKKGSKIRSPLSYSEFQDWALGLKYQMNWSFVSPNPEITTELWTYYNGLDYPVSVLIHRRTDLIKYPDVPIEAFTHVLSTERTLNKLHEAAAKCGHYEENAYSY